MKVEPLVSIIIVNWNGGKVFEECLKSLTKVNKPRWELILVDNGSTDESQLLINKIDFPATSVKLIQNKKNVGFAPANNQAYKEAKGKYILLLNNDTKATPNFLEPLVSKMEEDSSLGVIQPKIYLMDTDKLLDNAGSFMTRIGFLDHWGFMQKDSGEFDQEREIFSAKGACMLIRKSVVDNVGLFDDDFVSYFEESDFCWRVWLAGLKVIYYPKTHVFHKLGFTIRRQNVLDMNCHYYKNRISSLMKNLETKNLLLVLVPHLLISLGISLAFLLSLRFRSFTMVLRALVWNLLNILSTARKRKRIQDFRIISDDLLFKRVGKKIDWIKFYESFKRVQNDIVRRLVTTGSK